MHSLRRLLTLSLSAFALAALTSPLALAQPLELVGQTRTSGWTGPYPSLSSQGSATLQAPGVLQSLEFGERRDQGCYLKATFLGLDGTTLARTWDECGPMGPTDRSVQSLGGVSQLSRPYGITELLVLGGGELSTDPGHLKGVRIRRRNLLFDSDRRARFGQRGRELQFRRPNATYFSNHEDDTVFCQSTSLGNPTVAVGLHLGIDLRTGPDRIEKLRLICQEVRRAPPITTTTTGTTGMTAGTPLDQPTSTSFRPTGDFTTRHISGGAGAEIRVISGRPNEVLYAAEFGERNDDPCYLQTHWWDASNGRANVTTRTQTLDMCSGTANDKHYVGPSQSQIRGTTGPLRGVDRLEVCTNGRKDDNLKLKGVELRGSEPNESIYPGEPEAYEFMRPNCDDLPPPGEGSCTAGQHAVGLEVHYNKTGDRGSISGIALRCKAIEVD